MFLVSALVGLAMGNVVALQPMLMAERFGMRSYGALFGSASLVTQCGSATGLFLVGFLAEATGSYTVPFTISGGLALLAVCLALASGRSAIPGSGRPPL